MQDSLVASEFESWYSIADGLYLGDRDAGHDYAFLRKFKITKVVNCSGHALENDWENLGIDYLTYDWVDLASQTILDEDDCVINEIFEFIEDAVQQGQGVLVQSFNGHSRSVCVMAAFLMRRHKWSVHETLEYIHFRCPAINPNVGFLRQLQEYEQRLQDVQEYRFALTDSAREVTGAPNVESHLRDGETLQNTLSNTMPTVFAPRPPRIVGRKLTIQISDSDPQVALYQVGSCIDVDEEKKESKAEGHAASKPRPSSRAESPSKSLLKRPTYANRSPNAKLRPQSDKVSLDRWGRTYKRRASRLYTSSKCFDFEMDALQNLDRNAGQALKSLVAVAA
jgi:protein-tyrosine phosphatase